jgi:hypothetical protein
MKRIGTSLVFILVFGLTTVSFAKSRREFFYSEAIDNYTIIDQISAWSPLHNKAYQEKFENEFGLTNSVKNLLNDYKKIREKYIIKPDLKAQHLFPSNSIYLDTFSRAFFTADTMSEAYKNLKDVVGEEDHKFLLDFYDVMLKKIKPWRQQSQSFQNHIKLFEKEFKKGKGRQTIKKLINFFNLDKKEFRKIYYSFAWAPEFEQPSVEFMSNIMLIKINPVDKMARPDFSIIMSEIVDALLDAQSDSQKASFSSQFLKECKIKNMPSSLKLKWPLSIAAGAIVYSSHKNKKDFNIAKEWSKNPWVQSYSQILFILIEKSMKRRDHLMGKFLTESAVCCQNLINLSDFISGLE